jgi:hypothetical protein
MITATVLMYVVLSYCLNFIIIRSFKETRDSNRWDVADDRAGLTVVFLLSPITFPFVGVVKVYQLLEPLVLKAFGKLYYSLWDRED